MASSLMVRQVQSLSLSSRIMKKLIKCSSVAMVSQRDLNVHEHVGLEVLRDAGVNVPKFGVASSPEEARKVASEQLKGRFSGAIIVAH